MTVLAYLGSYPAEKQHRERKIIKISKECGLSITATSNVTFLDFLHITLNLKSKSYQ